MQAAMKGLVFFALLGLISGAGSVASHYWEQRGDETADLAPPNESLVSGIVALANAAELQQEAADQEEPAQKATDQEEPAQEATDQDEPVQEESGQEDATSAEAEYMDEPTAECLLCHGPFKSLMSEPGSFVVPSYSGEEKINPHRYVPHYTKEIPACANCHEVHPLPPESTVPKPDNLKYCYYCHHQENFTPCTSCHQDDGILGY